MIPLPAPTKRVLFVDDEPAILSGLKGLLRKQRHRWDMHFADGGEAALALLEASPFDVVVSDMRMPKMDGAELLARVRDDHPQVVRLVLSGHAERAAVFRVMPLAHQFLSKPCDRELLTNTIERACELHALLTAEPLTRAMRGLERVVPPPPAMFWEITRAMENADATPRHLARVLEQDPRVTQKLLDLANSVWLGPAPRAHDAEGAIARLGVDSARMLVLAAHVLSAMEHAPPVAGFSFRAFEAQALLTGKVALRMMSDTPWAHECFVAGMLHDVGKLLLAASRPEQFSELIASPPCPAESWVTREQALLGISHAEAGAHLLGSWGLPNPIVEAVAHHHAPGRVDQRGFEVVGCVHVAAALVAECLPAVPGVSCGEPAVERELLQKLGVEGRLAEWRALARAECQTWHSQHEAA